MGGRRAENRREAPVLRASARRAARTSTSQISRRRAIFVKAGPSSRAAAAARARIATLKGTATLPSAVYPPTYARHRRLPGRRVAIEPRPGAIHFAEEQRGAAPASFGVDPPFDHHAHAAMRAAGVSTIHAMARRRAGLRRRRVAQPRHRSAGSSGGDLRSCDGRPARPKARSRDLAAGWDPRLRDARVRSMRCAGSAPP